MIYVSIQDKNHKTLYISNRKCLWILFQRLHCSCDENHQATAAKSPGGSRGSDTCSAFPSGHLMRIKEKLTLENWWKQHHLNQLPLICSKYACSRWFLVSSFIYFFTQCEQAQNVGLGLICWLNPGLANIQTTWPLLSHFDQFVCHMLYGWIRNGLV